MTVKEIAVSAAALLQADDIESALASATSSVDDQDAKAMIKCVGLASAELGGEHPVIVTTTSASSGRRIPLSALGAVKSVRRVSIDGRTVSFGLDNRGITVPFDGIYTVEYTEPQDEPGLNDALSVGVGVDKQILTYLTARNYCLVTGRTDEASIWDQRYAAESEKLRISRRCRTPQRRWI